MRRFRFLLAIVIFFVYSPRCKSPEPVGTTSDKIAQDAQAITSDVGQAYPAYSEISKFHGHVCPGSAMGYRMACAAMDRTKLLRIDQKDLSAIVECNTCGVDALQCVTGCTFGNGKMLFDDYGKNVYTLFSAKTRKGVRVVFHGNGIPEGIRKDNNVFIKWLLTASEDKIVSIKEVNVERILSERIRQSEKCSICGEWVNSDRMRRADGKRICIPCSTRNK